MTNKMNEIWMLTVNNLYSYDSMEQTKAVFTDKSEALRAFNVTVSEYYKNELQLAEEMFEKDINSLDDIFKEIERVNNDYYMNGEYLIVGNSNIRFMENVYGIETSENYMKSTTYRILENELPSGDIEKVTDETYIILEKLELNDINRSCECLSFWQRRPLPQRSREGMNLHI